jgi:hypothetical protein
MIVGDQKSSTPARPGGMRLREFRGLAPKSVLVIAPLIKCTSVYLLFSEHKNVFRYNRL